MSTGADDSVELIELYDPYDPHMVMVFAVDGEAARWKMLWKLIVECFWVSSKSGGDPASF